MKKVILLSLLFASSTAFAEQSQINAIEKAAMQLDTLSLVSLTEQTSRYDQAFAYYRLAISQNLTAETKSAIESLNKAIATLEAHTEINADDGEAWALLAQSYGLKIGFEPIKGAYYGPKAGFAMKKAFEFAPDSPRTHLVQAVSDYNTPVMFGGSKSAALKALNTAIELFQSDTGDNQWGHAEAYVWRGLTHMSQDNAQLAKQDWQQAIDIAPDYGWAQMLLAKN